MFILKSIQKEKNIMDYKFKTKPYAHQLKALELSWDKSYFAYFMEMGTGKSKVLIDNIAMLYDKGKINGVLIVAPKGVVKTWYEQEIPTHMPDHVEHTDVLWQAMINKKQQKELDKLFQPGEDLHILVMNVEAFSTKKGVEFAARFLRCHRTMMAIDESKQMKHLALAQMNGKMMSTATVLTQLMRLQQITCGHFTADDGTFQEVDSNRLPELMDVLEEIEGKVVIWAHWQRDVHRILREISKKFGENSFVDYYGLTPMADRQKNIEKFQNNPECRFFIGTTQTGGYGITLTAASTMIYYSNGYDLEKRQQSEARIDRIGQKYPMTYIDIMCEKTVDERIVKALKEKVNIATQIMGEELKAWI
jgi:hypothetical protein